MVAGQDWHVPRLMSGDLVFRLETGGLSGCLSAVSNGRQGVMLSADEGWENRNARQSRPQPNRMLQGSNLLRSVTSSIPMWQLLPSDRTRTNNADGRRLKEGRLAGIVIPCNGPCVDSFAHIVVMLVGMWKKLRNGRGASSRRNRAAR
ncbi:hypothetical protein ALC60_09483 [Trachymyrmex zeteki]|uniref:Uncharacterized protein n=1 Tax=Mycetomoellerius zeteki TaxID=64791 RepID=A0A151WUI7_9HYME|nr:hypothetical protein ALC60_09483 [Trachymyrmex zeteki]